MRKYALRTTKDRAAWIGGRGNTFDNLDKAKARAQEYANRWNESIAVVTNKISSESVEICRLAPEVITVG